MEIILLESFDKLGKIGDVVKVKDGFARNFLLPQKKALRANKSNKEYYEKIKKDVEENNKKLVKDANSISEKLKKIEMIFLRQASETGQLYGSVTPKDISNFLGEKNINVLPSNINLTTPIKNIGIFEIIVKLHADVIVNITINVAISEEKALEQKKKTLEKENLDKKELPNDSSTENLISSKEKNNKDVKKKEEKKDDTPNNEVKNNKFEKEAKKDDMPGIKAGEKKKFETDDLSKETDQEK
tara:strand:+ start:1673 stop:2401 length:729 start_codon:yes stop_codon:yes gene_type:complete